MTTDGNTWRIKVSNSVLDPEKLKLMGGGAIVGKIPEGLPTLTGSTAQRQIIFKAASYSHYHLFYLVFMEAIAIAKAMAAKTGQKLDPNQELIGQGLANIFGSIGSSYAVSGSFSRSAVNLQAGAVSGVSSVITSIMVIITLLFLTPLLLPPAPGSTCSSHHDGRYRIGETPRVLFMHGMHKSMTVSFPLSLFFVTLAYAPHLDKGIMVGVALSMAVFLYRSMRPVVAKLSHAQRCFPAEHGTLPSSWLPPYSSCSIRRRPLFLPMPVIWMNRSSSSVQKCRTCATYCWMPAASMILTLQVKKNWL